jgi:hypothetical protein
VLNSDDVLAVLLAITHKVYKLIALVHTTAQIAELVDRLSVGTSRLA